MSSETEQNINEQQQDPEHAEMVLSRLREYSRSANNSELAEKLGITPSALTYWIKRNSVGWRRIFDKFPDVDGDWLRTGVKSRRTTDDISPPAADGMSRPRLDPSIIPDAVHEGFRQTFSGLSRAQLATILQILGYRSELALYMVQTEPPEKLAALISRLMLDKIGYDTDRLPG